MAFSASTMASLSDLPTELLSSILQYTTKEDCLALLTVDRRLYGAAKERLYRDITFEWTDKFSPVCKLLRSLLENQQLRTLVKSLELHHGDRCRPRHTPPTFPLTTVDQNKASSVIRNTRFPNAETWEIAIKKGSLDAIVSLLVVLLPNLGRLSVLDNFARDNRILSQTALFAAQSSATTTATATARDSSEGSFGEGFQPTLSNLYDVTIFQRRNAQIEPKFKKTPDILGWFYLPSIQRLRLSIDNPMEFTWPLSLPPPRPQNLRYLALDQIRESRALPILTACAGLGLKELAWNIRHEYGPDADVIPERPCIDLSLVTAALAPLHGSLEILNLGAECFPGYLAYDEPPMNLLGSIDLANFTCLKSLVVPWSIFMGLKPQDEDGNEIRSAGTLPPSLTSLIFNHALEHNPENEWEDADYLATSCDFLTRLRYTPHLRQFRLHLSFDEISCLEELENVCKEAGITPCFVDKSEESFFAVWPLPWCWLWAAPT